MEDLELEKLAILFQRANKANKPIFQMLQILKSKNVAICIYLLKENKGIEVWLQDKNKVWIPQHFQKLFSYLNKDRLEQNASLKRKKIAKYQTKKNEEGTTLSKKITKEELAQ